MPRIPARNKTLNRQRESGAHEFSRVERWLNEIGDSDRSALPLDFFEAVEALSHLHQHPHPHPHAQPLQHQHEQEHQHQLEHQPPHPQVKYFDYRDSSSSDTSGRECSKVTATESETDLKQSDSSSLSPASLNSNKLKIFKEAHKQQQQNIPGGCGDNKVSSTSDQQQQQQQQQSLHQPQPPLLDSVKQSEGLPPQNGVTCRFHLYRRRSPSSASKLSSTISSSSTSSSTSESACRNSRRQRRRRQLNLLRSLKAEDPALVRISAHRGVSISLGDVTDDRRRAVAVSGASWRAVMSAVGDLSHAVPGLMSPADVNSSVSTPLEVVKAAAQSEAEVSERRPQKRAKVVHDRGHGQAAVPSLQMKSTVQCRSLKDQSGQHRSQQDLSGQQRSQQDQYGQHRSQQDKSGQHRRSQQDQSGQHRSQQDQSGQHRSQQDQSGQHRSQQDQSGQHSSLEDQSGQHRSQQDLSGQHRSQEDQSGQHRSQQDQSGKHRSQQDQAGQHRSQQDQSGQHRKHQQRQNQADQPVSLKSNDYKLAQNVRFQLITPQRESMFEQDSATGRPVHPRLRSLLASMGMDMIFLERSVGPKNVPSVKVRFLLNKFEQLTEFCNAIDYQLPRQSSV